MFKDFIDLSHALDENIPTWTGSCGFELKTFYEGEARVNQFTFHLSSAGTHMDSPSHFCRDGKLIPELALENMLIPLCVIEAVQEADADFFLSKEHVLHYEKLYGKIPPGCFVAIHSGWDRYWKNPEKYRDVDENGIIHSPGLSKEAGNVLLERGIAGLGVDTLSPDGSNMELPIHFSFLGAGKYIVENLTNLDKVPPTGAYIALFPIKIAKASESPVRAVAMIV